MHSLAVVPAVLQLLLAGAQAGCPYADLGARQADAASASSRGFLAGDEIDDSTGFMTTEAGGPISDQISLKAGPRGATLLEDFILRQKIQHFDHERVPERAVHARGAGAFGTFTSHGDWSNITAASFLSKAGKKASTFVRFSTVAGSRGSADTARDVHGFATRFYTDEGNFDIVGNNIPVFFIQDAIQFPDLIHSVKPSPDSEIPQAATAHDSAWDFFSQQTTTLNTLMWAMSGYGLPRSYRHMDGFGVHTFRFVTDAGQSKLVKFHWKSKQGKASLLWEEAQVLAGKNADFHRKDLWDAIASGNGPEWDFAVQIVEEADALKFGFDMLDPTKFVPEELAPLHVLGTMKLDANPQNYFAETEQVMFQPGHVVRGVDFSEDPLLQGRLFSYLDTQLNRNGGPNFEQLPINRPINKVHNNSRDGMGQMLIHKNIFPYSPNTLNKGMPAQADQKNGKGFFTAPGRRGDGNLVREISKTFADHWSQARLFLNSLTPAEQQFIVNAIRFETSNLQSRQVKQNVLAQLNKVSNELAQRVATALGMAAPRPDPTYYHNNRTAFVSIVNSTLPSIKTLHVGVLASTGNGTTSQAASIKARLQRDGLIATIVGETLTDGIDQTYSAADATAFDGLFVAPGAESLFRPDTRSTLYPLGRPSQILLDGYRWGKPVAAVGSASSVFNVTGIPSTPGVYAGRDLETVVKGIEDGLKTFKFVDRFPLDGQ